MGTVTLQPVDDNLLSRLLDTAVADAEPDEVMPPVPGPPGWTEKRRAAFREYHRSAEENSYAVLLSGRVVGGARLAPAESPGAVEAGIWLARSIRGQGYGAAVLRLLIDEARSGGAAALIAETTASNPAAVGVLRALGAKIWVDQETGAVHATLRVGETAGRRTGA